MSRVPNDSAVGWVDVAGRPFPRVPPTAIGSRPIAGTMQGTVHSLASMGLKGHEGTHEENARTHVTRRHPAGKGKGCTKGPLHAPHSNPHSISLEQALPVGVASADPVQHSFQAGGGSSGKGVARPPFPPRPPGAGGVRPEGMWAGGEVTHEELLVPKG